KLDGDPRIQKAQFAQAVGQRLVAEVSNFKDLPVRPERDGGARPLLAARGKLADHRKRARHPPTLEGDGVDLPVAEDLALELLRQRIHTRDAHPVQTARTLVRRALLPEL